MQKFVNRWLDDGGFAIVLFLYCQWFFYAPSCTLVTLSVFDYWSIPLINILCYAQPTCTCTLTKENLSVCVLKIIIAYYSQKLLNLLLLWRQYVYMYVIRRLCSLTIDFGFAITLLTRACPCLLLHKSLQLRVVCIFSVNSNMHLQQHQAIIICIFLFELFDYELDLIDDL